MSLRIELFGAMYGLDARFIPLHMLCNISGVHWPELSFMSVVVSLSDSVSPSATRKLVTVRLIGSTIAQIEVVYAAVARSHLIPRTLDQTGIVSKVGGGGVVHPPAAFSGVTFTEIDIIS